MLIIGLFLISLGLALSFQSFKLSERYDTGQDTEESLTDGQFVAQTFTIGVTGDNENIILAGVSAKLRKGGNPIDFQIHVCNVNATNAPDSTNCLSSNTTMAPADIGGVSGWVNVSMPPITLSASTTYSIILNTTSAGADKYFVGSDHSAPTYGGGSEWISVNQGGSWENKSNDGGTDWDIMFKIYRDILPNITTLLLNPANNSNQLGTIYFEANSTSENMTLANATYYLWNSTALINETVRVVTGIDSQNTTNVTISGILPEEYLWNVKSCGYNLTDTICNWGTNRTLKVGAITSAIYYNTTAYQTASEDFIANISVVSGYTPTSGIFWYNGTEYAATITNTAGNNYSLSRTIDIATDLGNKTWFFKWDLNGLPLQTSNYSSNTSLFNFSLCSGVVTNKYLNLTFKDESTNLAMNATIDTSTFYYWLGSGAVNKSYIYTTTGNSSYYSFCALPQDRTINLKSSVQYSYLGYPQKRWSAQDSYVNTSTNQILYLLPSTDGLYVTFQVINQADQTIEGVFVNATRTIGGSKTLVASGYTDAAGAVTFWLNPDYSHDFVFDAAGYDLYETTITPTSSSYTVQLGQEAASDTPEYSRGILVYIRPQVSELLNATTYNFNITVNSSYWSLDSFGFILTNGSINFGGNSSTAATGGTLTYELNTGSNETIQLQYYYVVNGSSFNSTKSWYVLEGDFGFGLKRFFTDLKTYINDGIFGLNSFSVNLIVFLLIFCIVGIISYMSGVQNLAAITWMVFVLVVFFDYAVGLFPTIGVQYLSTIIVGMLALALTIREVAK